jgi:glycosyltransferase involved in cell wall biosynthesis
LRNGRLNAVPRIGIDARWLLGEPAHPHAALLRALLQTNQMRPFAADFVLYADREPTNTAACDADNVTVVVTGGPSARDAMLADDRWLNLDLRWAVRRSALDLFFSPYYKVPLLLRAPRINMIHDLSFFVLPPEMLPIRLRSPMRRWLLRQAMRLHHARVVKTLTVSNYSKRCLEGILGFDSDRISVCHNGVDAAFFASDFADGFAEIKRRYRLPDAYVLFVGSGLAKKNIDGLLAAHASLPPDLSARFPLVLKTAAADRVFIIDDNLPTDAMAALIGSARALVLVSFDEGFGIPVAEAMAAGVPVVVSRSGALEEIAAGAGVLVNPADVTEITAALRAVLDGSEEQRRQWQESGRRRARSLSAAAAADRLFAEFTAVLGQERRPSADAELAEV